MIEVFLKLPSGESVKVDDEMSVFTRETFQLFFNKSCKVSSDENAVIDNYGDHCDVQIFTSGKHKLTIEHGHLFKRTIDVHCKLRTAVKLNLSFTNPTKKSVVNHNYK